MHNISSDTLHTDIWKIFDDYASQDICLSDLELPPHYDHLKLPVKPIEVNIAFFIRQLSQVHEDKMSYDLSLSMWIGWQDERLIGQTETAGCNPFVYKSRQQPELWIPGNSEEHIFYEFALTITCASELTFVASKDLHHLQKLLENEAGFVIYESGHVVAYISAEIHSNCKEMDFSAYPRDKHKCEFLIYSPIFVKVGATLPLKHQIFYKLYSFKDTFSLHTTLYNNWTIQSALPYEVFFSNLPENHTYGCVQKTKSVVDNHNFVCVIRDHTFVC